MIIVFKCYIKFFKTTGEMFNFVSEKIGTESTEQKKLVKICLSMREVSHNVRAHALRSNQNGQNEQNST